MGRPRATYRRMDHRVMTCLTEEAADALRELMRQNPYQTKSNVLSKAIVLLYEMGRQGYTANLDPLPLQRHSPPAQRKPRKRT